MIKIILVSLSLLHLLILKGLAHKHTEIYQSNSSQPLYISESFGILLSENPCTKIHNDNEYKKYLPSNLSQKICSGNKNKCYTMGYIVKKASYNILVNTILAYKPWMEQLEKLSKSDSEYEMNQVFNYMIRYNAEEKVKECSGLGYYLSQPKYIFFFTIFAIITLDKTIRTIKISYLARELSQQIIEV